MITLQLNYRSDRFTTYYPNYSRNNLMTFVEDILDDKYGFTPVSPFDWPQRLLQFGYANFLTPEGKKVSLEERWIKTDGSELQFILKDWDET